MKKNNNDDGNKLSISKEIKMKLLLPLFAASLTMFSIFPDNVVLAARSGGRSGGSSFRASPSSSFSRGSSTSLRGSSRGYSTSYGGPSLMPMPMFSPFGYGYGYGMGGFGILPIGGGLTNLILLGTIAYVLYNNFSRLGGSDFDDGNDGNASALGNGATVMKLQIAMSTDWSERDNIIETLTKLAERNSILSGRRDLARLLSESSLALLRRQKDWNACAYEGEKFTFNQKEAEPFFQRLAISERSKFEEETNPNSVALIKDNNDANISKPTQMVVSLLIALRGTSGAYSQNVRSINDCKTFLQNLAGDALTNEGDNVMAVEILWTPSEKNNVLTERDLIEDYPELIKF
jgi:uncharacterized membrane protein